ncbi:MAG: formate dehydrogenase [Pseudomonadota bacterium]|nr:MAG: formate dehydrogenase [Pseudomonadota bacterium]
MSEAKVSRSSRRRFLRNMAAVSGAATAAVATHGAIAAPDTEPGASSAPAAQPQGYRETAHIRAYYDKARF